MTKLSELKLHPPKILLLGKAGSGKTLLATTLGARLQVLDFDNGLMSAMRFEDHFSEERRKIDVRACWEEDANKAIAWEKGRSLIFSIAQQCNDGTYPYQAVCIDSYTSFMDASVNNVQALNNKLGQMPSQPKWGIAFAQVERCLTVLKSLPIVVIVIAHLRRIDVADKEAYEILSPGRKLPLKIPTWFDEMWNMFVKDGGAGEKKFLLQTVASSAVDARSRGCLKDQSDANLGMVELLRQMGYEFKDKEVK